MVLKIKEGTALTPTDPGRGAQNRYHVGGRKRGVRTRSVSWGNVAGLEVRNHDWDEPEGGVQELFSWNKKKRGCSWWQRCRRKE